MEKTSLGIEIVDIARNSRYEVYIYKCLAPMPFRRCKSRSEYLEEVTPRVFARNSWSSGEDVKCYSGALKYKLFYFIINS
ncbi:MAG: hypothetical protein DRJ51_05835 [Thermoprotei archaeon]|nr:MAG: hypothetical protein DRJ51_05835 [Thermoprotei archaeon]